MKEADLRRMILCDRKAYMFMGDLVTDCPGDCLAHLLGYHGMYLGAARTARGWRTPARGDYGPGWPDLVLMSTQRKRILFAELKSEKGTLRQEQRAVLAGLEAAGLEAYVWRPADMDSGEIYRILAR